MSKTKLRRGEIEIDTRYERRVARLAALEPAAPSVGDVTGAVTLAEQDRLGLTRRAPRQTLVLPERVTREPVVARPVPPLDINIPQQAIMSVDMHTTAVDRAKGFAIETHQLSVVAGVLAVLVFVAGLGHPFWSLSTLTTFFVWYSLVWLAAWLFHRVISPEGLAFFNALMMWRYIFSNRGKP
jgi:hypothetical protein